MRRDFRFVDNEKTTILIDLFLNKKIVPDRIASHHIGSRPRVQLHTGSGGQDVFECASLHSGGVEELPRGGVR